jgi:hypothetical protein
MELKLKAGTLMCFSEGEYSDYGYTGHYLVVQDLTVDTANQIAAEMNAAKEAAEDRGDYGLSDIREQFQARLIREGYLLSIPVTEWHIGSYGRLTP